MASCINVADVPLITKNKKYCDLEWVESRGQNHRGREYFRPMIQTMNRRKLTVIDVVIAVHLGQLFLRELVRAEVESMSRSCAEHYSSNSPQRSKLVIEIKIAFQ